MPHWENLFVTIHKQKVGLGMKKSLKTMFKEILTRLSDVPVLL